MRAFLLVDSSFRWNDGLAKLMPHNRKGHAALAKLLKLLAGHQIHKHPPHQQA
jgi:hypothetical protein